MPQSATLTTFRAPVSGISHFDFFEKLTKAFKISIADIWFLTKEVVSLAYAVCKKSCSNILNLLMF